MSLRVSNNPAVRAFTEEEASRATESLQGTSRFREYANLRGFIKPAQISTQALAKQELESISPDAMDKNWNLSKYFGHIKVISLNAKTPRFQTCAEELSKVGILPEHYEISPGVKGTDLDPSIWSRMVKWGTDGLSPQELNQKLQGQTGCYMAHYNAIKDSASKFEAARIRVETLRSNPDASSEELLAALQDVRKYSSVFIFEDNVGFGRVTGSNTADTKGCGRLFRLVMRDLPSDGDSGWDMVYLQSMNFKSIRARKVGEVLGTLQYGLVMKAFAINAKMYPRLLEELSVIDKPGHEIKPVDHVPASLHKTSNSYVAIPALCYRYTSLSEVKGALLAKKSKPAHWQSDIKFEDEKKS